MCIHVCRYIYILYIFIYLSIHTYTRIRTGKLHRYAYTCDGGRPMLDRETRMSPRRRLQLLGEAFLGSGKFTELGKHDAAKQSVQRRVRGLGSASSDVQVHVRILRQIEWNPSQESHAASSSSLSMSRISHISFTHRGLEAGKAGQSQS